MNKKSKIFNIVIIAMFTALLFVQEQVLSFLPNIQLTVFLIILYSKIFGFTKTIIIVFIHTFLDCLVTGSLNFYFTTFMFLGWSAIPVLLTIIFRKVNSNIGLAFLSILFALIYCYFMIIPNIILSRINIIVYLINDIPFEILLAMSSFLSVLLLYNPCNKALKSLFEF